LLARRAQVSDQLAKAEAEWLAFGEQLETLE
jgi:ATP-binding cassette subfamily F protein 3